MDDGIKLGFGWWYCWRMLYFVFICTKKHVRSWTSFSSSHFAFCLSTNKQRFSFECNFSQQQTRKYVVSVLFHYAAFSDKVLCLSVKNGDNGASLGFCKKCYKIKKIYKLFIPYIFGICTEYSLLEIVMEWWRRWLIFYTERHTFIKTRHWSPWKKQFTWS